MKNCMFPEYFVEKKLSLPNRETSEKEGYVPYLVLSIGEKNDVVENIK